MNKINHQLKTWADAFQAVWTGNKKYEIRNNDRNFYVGDTLILKEYFPDSDTYSGREIHCVVNYITLGGQWGLPPELCVMSIETTKRVHPFSDS